jgi:hypothetical protein
MIPNASVMPDLKRGKMMFSAPQELFIETRAHTQGMIAGNGRTNLINALFLK